MAENSTTHGFWEFKKYGESEWFKFQIITLIALALLYLLLHFVWVWVNKDAGYEYKKLDKDQLQQINIIYFDAANRNGAGAPVERDSSAAISQDAPPQRQALDTNMRLRSQRAIDYIYNQFNDKVDSAQIAGIRLYLYSSLPVEAVSFLGNVRFRVKSYFWLVGPEVYFEIIFWSWFGVIASLLFNLSVIIRKRTDDPNNPKSVFDSSEIPYQVAKFFYAPLATLAIVLGYNFFSDQNIADISSSKGVIVFAFIGGFYCSRLIAFLDRLKEVLLPVSGSADAPAQNPSTAPLLQNIKLDLELDEETIPAEMINDLAEGGFDGATVTLQHDETGEIVTAEKPVEDQASTFTVASIKPGSYTIKALLSKEVNGQPINLHAEQKEELKTSESVVTVLLKKDKDEG